MQETWLRTNRRILLLGMILPAVLILGGLIVAVVGQSGGISWFNYVGFAVAASGLALLAILLAQMNRPRLAYAEGEVLVYLRAGRPIRLPVEVVECFFLAAGVGQLPGADRPGNPAAKSRHAGGGKSDRLSTLRRESGLRALGRRLCRFSRRLVRTTEPGTG